MWFHGDLCICFQCWKHACIFRLFFSTLLNFTKWTAWPTLGVVSGEAGLRDAERLERRCCACARRGRGAWLDRGRGHRPARELGNRGIPKESQPSHHCHRGESMPSYISIFFHYFFKMFRLPSKVERWQSHLASVFVDLAGIKGI